MNITTSVTNSIRSYGSDITILGKDKITSTTGFIQPISYHSSNYNDFDCTDISRRDNIRYLMIAQKDADLCNGDNVVLCDTTYNVIRVQDYVYRNKLLYRWAILRLYYPLQEDDFDDSSKQ